MFGSIEAVVDGGRDDEKFVPPVDAGSVEVGVPDVSIVDVDSLVVSTTAAVVKGGMTDENLVLLVDVGSVKEGNSDVSIVDVST